MKKVPLSPNACYQISQKTGSGRLFQSHDDYLHFLFLYSRQVLPLASTFAYCLLPDSFNILLQIRDEGALHRHTERVGESVEEVVRDLPGYLERRVSNFVERYHNSLSTPIPANERSWHCEILPTKREVAHRLELLHLYPLYHEAVEENGR